MIDNREKVCYSDSRVTNAGEKARIHVVFDILVPEYRTSANLVRLYRRKEKMKKEALRIEGPLQICRGFLCVLHNFIQVLLGKMTNANYFLTA